MQDPEKAPGLSTVEFEPSSFVVRRSVCAHQQTTHAKATKNELESNFQGTTVQEGQG